MRRLIAGTTAALVVGAVAVTVLGTGGSSLADAPTVQPELKAPAGQTAIRSGDTVTFGGSVTPGSTKVSAFIRFFRADDSEFRTPLEVTSSVSFDPVTGAISGSRPLNLSPNNPPGSANGHGGRVV